MHVEEQNYEPVTNAESWPLVELAALGQLTLKQQETYRHERREKSDSAQKKVRNQLYKTSIPKILRRKLSGSAVSGKSSGLADHL